MATSVADAGGGGGDGPGDGGDDRKPWNQSSMYDDIYTGEKKKRKRKKRKNKATKAEPGEEKGPETEPYDEEEKEDEWPSWENQALGESEETVEEEPRPVTLMQATSKSAPSAAPLPAPLPPQDDAPAGEEGSTAAGSQPTPSQGLSTQVEPPTQSVVLVTATLSLASFGKARGSWCPLSMRMVISKFAEVMD